MAATEGGEELKSEKRGSNVRVIDEESLNDVSGSIIMKQPFGVSASGSLHSSLVILP